MKVLQVVLSPDVLADSAIYSSLQSNSLYGLYEVPQYLGKIIEMCMCLYELPGDSQPPFLCTKPLGTS